MAREGDGQGRAGEKKVDEAWKDSVAGEKSATGDAAHPAREVTFSVFVTGLMMDAFVALGEIENPLVKAKETNLPHAKFIIDILSLLQEKTKNNLTQEESGMLEQMLYELRMRYVERSKKV